MAIVALSSGVLVAISVAQWRTNSKLEQRLATVVEQNEENAKQLQQAQAARVKSERELAELNRTTAALEEQVRTQELARTIPPPAITPSAKVAEAGSENTGLGTVLSKMMQDPDTKKFIRDQQRLMMDQMYAPLVKKLGLSPAEAAQFKDLLADNAMKMAEKASAMLGAPTTERAEFSKTMAAEQTSFDEQVKALLGEERFTAYKEYQETVADRTQLTMFKQQFSSSDYPINDIQTEQLLAWIKEERRNEAAATGLPLPGSSQGQQDMDSVLSPEKSERLLRAQESVNQRVFERARTLLSPEQLQSFGTFQSNQLQTMRMGLSMARKMLGGDQGQADATAQNP